MLGKEGRKGSQGSDGKMEQIKGQKDDKRRTDGHIEWLEEYKGEMGGMTDARKDDTRKGRRRQEGNKEKTKHLNKKDRK